MNSSADALLALSNTAAAMADAKDRISDDDDRSSSLSELEDAGDLMDMEMDDMVDKDEDDTMDMEQNGQEMESALPPSLPPQASQDQSMADGDSEAETERLEESPDKTKKTFQISPSKLAQTVNASDDIRPEIEELTDSQVSSPMTPVADSPIDELSDADDVLEEGDALTVLSQAAAATSKRKRLSDIMDIVSEERPRKRRTESLSEPEEDEELESDPESEAEKPGLATPATPLEPVNEKTTDKEAALPDVPQDEDKAESSDTSKTKKTTQYTRARSRRGKDLAEDVQDEDEIDGDQSDEDAVADDADTAAKSEEEQVKRSNAMDALTALEQHFAGLRDKLYDDKITSINKELAQLSAVEPDHPELLKQFDCINKYCTNKQEIEQKLLVYKVGALKRKSVAERSQIHSAYFQTIRDVRERHLERMSERFYRIQRERFKSTQTIPAYSIPFPDKRSIQVQQQTAYNKEVSILSGVAKYVGFPAAPKLQQVIETDLNHDLQKMGVSDNKSGYGTMTDSPQINATSSRIRQAAQARHAALNANVYTTNNATTAISTSAAAASATSEQQFIESTPWANPNHPIHRIGRQQASKSPLPESYATPTNQAALGTDLTSAPGGSASTIVENPTPQTDGASSAVKPEPVTNGNIEAISPSETRRTINNMLQAGATAAAAVAQQRSGTPASDNNAVYLGVNSSPLQARASLLSSLNRTASAAAMREQTKSPFRRDLVASGGGGMGRFGFR